MNNHQPRDSNVSPHPTRAAVICRHCRFFLNNGGLKCNHPSTPVSVMDGAPQMFCATARQEQGLCGPNAALFVANDGSGHVSK